MISLHEYRPSRQTFPVVFAFLIGLSLLSAFCLLRQTGYRLQIEMYSSVPSDAQVFYDVGRGYNQADSRSVALTPGAAGLFQTLSFPIPSGVLFHIRFDPIASPGSFTVRRVVLHGSGGGDIVIPPVAITPLNQIGKEVRHDNAVTFTTTPNANDPGLLLNLPHPVDCRQYTGWYWALLGVSLTALCFLVRRQTRRFYLVAAESLKAFFARSGIKQLHARIQGWAQQMSDPNFIRFDAGTVYFLGACLLCFSLAVAADLNGSSIGIYQSAHHIGAPENILFGEPRAVRADEWAYETPLILNQALKIKPFFANESFVGGHRIALIAGAPVYHFSTWFRPQFWAFFVLPIDYAFAAFWQCKALLLVTGVFALLLLLTQSSFWAAAGSLWLFFSPLTQWTYSWPSELPEMIGLLCLTVVFSCYVTTGKNPWALAFASLAMASCAINFVLCGYVLHLIPLAWFGVFVFLGWCLAKRQTIFRLETAKQRTIALLFGLVLIGFAGITLHSQLHVAIDVMSHTAYPGQRRLPGGTYPIQDFISHFFLWTENENHFLPALSNICEATGVLWLAPVTLFIIRGLTFQSFQKYILGAMWLFCLLILIWLSFPIPELYGKWTAINMTGGTRCLPALALANIAIVSLCVSSLRRHVVSRRPLDTFFRVVSVFLVVLCILDLADKLFGGYFSPPEMYLAAVVTTLLIELLVSGRQRWLAVLLIVPQAILYGGVNPVERGIDVVTSSALFEFVHSRRELMAGRWLVFSPSHLESGYLACLGLNVYTGLKYLPDIDHYHLLDVSGLPVESFNRGGVFVAVPLKAGAHSTVAVPAPYQVLWGISPSDPILRAIGIQYFAFAQKPPAEIESQLIPLHNGALSGLWIYRSK